MNQASPNRKLNFICRNNVNESRYADQHPPHLPLDKYQFKGRAYINPQVLNCKYIKKSLYEGSLPAGNKIHVNPNFKGNGFNHGLSGSNLQMPVRTEWNPNLVKIHELGSKPSGNNQIGSSNCEVAVMPSTSLNLNEIRRNDKKINNIPISQYKAVNNISLKSGNNFKKSKYFWSKKSHTSNVFQDCPNQISTGKSPVHLNNKIKLNNQRSMNCGFSASEYKYTAPDKKLESITLTGKSSALNKKFPPVYLSKTKIINKSNTKLINRVSPQVKLNFKQLKSNAIIKRNIKSSEFAYNKYKKSPSVKIACLVRNKYKYFKMSRNSRIYKIDKRKKLPESSKKQESSREVHDIRKLFPQNIHCKVKSLFGNMHTRFYYGAASSKNIHSWSRNQTSENITLRKANHYSNKKVVKIGGILYKSTGNKLTLASKKDVSIDTKKLLTKSKGKKSHIVYVRGEKFFLDKNGKTLRKSKSSDKDKSNVASLKRIDIGGVTYVQKSHNVLIRTNVHQARNVVNQAKHKSIAVLSNLYKRSRMPCMLFHKFGRCMRHNKGLCMYKHDPKNVSICKKFLKGSCTDENCLLSHEVIQEKMATCHFFLNGLCNRENCPFLHVKLNKNVAICENFLQGFCVLGKNCTKRHLYQCPKFEKFGTCSEGTKCLYPHRKTAKQSKENSPSGSDKTKNECEPQQYYVKPLPALTAQKQGNIKKCSKLKNKQSKNDTTKTLKRKAKRNQFSSCFSNLDDTVECVPKRIKLDELPCFIPLK